MNRLASSLLRTTAAALVLAAPAQAEIAGNGVYYRGTAATFDLPIPLGGDGTPLPVQPQDESAPLTIETTGSTTLAYGDPLSIRFTPKGGRSADWSMAYTGARPSWLTVVESDQDVVLSAAAVPDGADLTLSVSLADKVETTSRSLALKVSAPNSTLAVETTGTTSLAYGSALSLKLAAKGGKSSAWQLTYTGARPEGILVTQNASDVTVTAPPLQEGTYGPFSVSLTDGVRTVVGSLTATVATATPVLSVVSASGTTASVAPAAAWNYVFDVAGGKGPYTIETTPPLSGNLASVTATTTANKVTLAGSAPLGTYPMTVKATDSAGKSVSTTLNVVVENPKTASTTAPTGLVNPLGGYVGVGRRHADQADWNILTDGTYTTSYVTSGPGNSQSDAAGVSFSTPVTFSSVYYTGENYGKLWIRQVDGTWVDAGSFNLTAGNLNLGKTYTATAVAFANGGYKVFDLRVGAGPATTALPTLPTGINTVATANALVAAAGDFATANPYHSGSFDLSETPTQQNGVVLSVTGSEVRVASRPANGAEVFVHVRDSTGSKGYIKYLVQSQAGQAASLVAPTGILNPLGGYVGVGRRYLDQADWNILTDGSYATSYVTSGASTGRADAAGVVFSSPITFNSVYYTGENYGNLWIRLTDGTWVDAGNHAFTAGNIVLPKPVTATAVAFANGGYKVFDLRVGAGPATTALPTLPTGINTVAPTNALVAATGDFATLNPYHKGSFDLSETPTQQNGVVLSVTGSEVRVASRPSNGAEVFVHVRDSTGSKGYIKYVVQAQSGQAASLIAPTGILNPLAGYAGVGRRYLDQADWNILTDGTSSASYVTSGPTTGRADAAGVVFSSPITFNSVYYTGENYGNLWIRLTDGAWVDAGNHAFVTGNIALPKPVAATAVAFANGGYKVFDLRVGAGPATTALPTYTAGASVVAAAATTVASAADFATLNPYHKGSLDLSGTPTQQNGVVLSVSSSGVSVASRPAETVDVFVHVKDSTGTTSYLKFQIVGTAGAATSSYVRATGLVNPLGGEAGVVRKNASQPDWSVLHDNSTATYVTSGAGTSQAQAAGVSYSAPVTFNTIFYNGETTGNVWIRLVDGTWVDAGFYANIGTLTLAKAYTATAVAIANGGSKIYEIRTGNAASVTY